MTLNAYEVYSADQVAKAKARNPKLKYLVETAAACNDVGLPFWLGCALYDKETGSYAEQNIFGHDSGGAMYGKGLVTEENYREFKRLIDGGKTSNGVGPLQATWKPHFATMESRGLKPWVPGDSMRYLLGVFASYLTGDKMHPSDAAIKMAGTRYNGSSAYGDRLLALAKSWRQTVGEDPIVPVPEPPPGPVPTDGKTPWRKTNDGRQGYACPCMILIIPVAEARLKLAGKIKYCIDFTQLAYSFATQSKGIHGAGGGGDISFPMDDESLTIMRECGLDAHHRPAIAGVWGEHVHFLVRGCPHRSPAADAQVALFVRGYDGLVGNRKYTGPAPKKVGSWKDAYAKYKHLLDPPVPVPPPVPPVYIGPYWVDPAKVQTVLLERNVSDGTVYKEHPPRTKITKGVAIAALDGKDFLFTDYGTRYAMEFLTAVEPAPPPDPEPEPPVPEDPKNTERFLTLNFRRLLNAAPTWTIRKPIAFAAVKSVDPSVIMVQECVPSKQRPPGYTWVSRGNVGVGWKAAIWEKVSSKSYDLITGSDDRWLVTVVLKHKKTGRSWKFGSTHLTNLEGGTSSDGWRLGQGAEILAFAPDLDILGGDFNDSGVIYDLFRRGGLEMLQKRLTATDFVDHDLATTHGYGSAHKGKPIDNVLTSKRVQPVKAWILRTDRNSTYPKATDHHGVAMVAGVDLQGASLG